MTPIERAVDAVEKALVGHVDPTSHAMSEYGIAKMIVPIVLAAIREPSDVMLDRAYNHMEANGCDPRFAWEAMIDAMLEEG